MPAKVSTRGCCEVRHGETHLALAHPPSHQPMIPALRSVSPLWRLWPVGEGGGGRTLISQEVSQGHLLLFLLLGRCKKPPLAICVSSVVAVQSGAKKSRLVSDGRTLRSPRQLTHDCGLADYARKDFFRALSGSSAKSVFYSGSGLFFWLRGCVRSFVCGVSSSFPNGNLKLCVRWASLMSSPKSISHPCNCACRF